MQWLKEAFAGLKPGCDCLTHSPWTAALATPIANTNKNKKNRDPVRKQTTFQKLQEQDRPKHQDFRQMGLGLVLRAWSWPGLGPSAWNLGFFEGGPVVFGAMLGWLGFCMFLLFLTSPGSWRWPPSPANQLQECGKVTKPVKPIQNDAFLMYLNVLTNKTTTSCIILIP